MIILKTIMRGVIKMRRERRVLLGLRKRHEKGRKRGNLSFGPVNVSVQQEKGFCPRGRKVLRNREGRDGKEQREDV